MPNIGSNGTDNLSVSFTILQMKRSYNYQDFYEILDFKPIPSKARDCDNWDEVWVVVEGLQDSC